MVASHRRLRNAVLSTGAQAHANCLVIEVGMYRRTNTSEVVPLFNHLIDKSEVGGGFRFERLDRARRGETGTS